jgi:hypothetical protein
MKCNECGSCAINHQCHGRDGSDGNLCDVCYWRKRSNAAKAEISKLFELNRVLQAALYDSTEALALRLGTNAEEWPLVKYAREVLDT